MIKENCIWTEEQDGNWDTACKETFILIEGTPRENQMKYCPYCGNLIIEQPFKYELEEE